MFSPTTTVIVGKNGTGKTSLLEAIYIGYRGSSFKGVDSDILRDKSEWYRIDVKDESDRIVRYMADNTGRMKKTFEIDTKKNYRLPQKNKYPIILFTPDDTRLINGSPSRRRKYFDQIISQYNPEYAALIRRYERALLQRNKLLKLPHVTTDDIFSWNIIISNTGASIIAERKAFSEYINERLSAYYQSIAGNSDEVYISYIHPVTTAGTIMSHLEANFVRDRITGNTSVGPHRHDYHLSLRGKLADDIASRGEIRTIILALKYIEADKLREVFDKNPLILLDDVFGELDDARQKHLIQSFDDSQIIITSAVSTNDSYDTKFRSFKIGDE